MRNRLLGALAAGSLLLAVPVGAAAQTEDPCYVDPTAPECVGDDDGTTDDGTTDDGTEIEERVVTRTPTAPTGTAAGTTTGVLARTGLETGTLVALFVGLLAAGGALLFTTRRRSTS